MWFSVVRALIEHGTRHHSGQNVVDSKPHFRARGEKGIARHVGKLANEITRLAAIVVKFMISSVLSRIPFSDWLRYSLSI